MADWKKVAHAEVPWKWLIIVLVVIGAVGGTVYGFLRLKDGNVEQEYQQALQKLHGLVDIEGEMEENEPHPSREEMQELLKIPPSQTGTYGAKLVDMYEFSGPLNSHRLSLRYQKNADHKWVLEKAKTYWVPGKMVRPHRDAE